MALVYWSLAEIYCLQVGNKARLSAPHCPYVHRPNSRLEKSSWGPGQGADRQKDSPRDVSLSALLSLGAGMKIQPPQPVLLRRVGFWDECRIEVAEGS